MRVFWSLVALLVLVALGIPVVSAMSSRQKPKAEPAAFTAPSAAEPEPGEPTAEHPPIPAAPKPPPRAAPSPDPAVEHVQPSPVSVSAPAATQEPSPEIAAGGTPSSEPASAPTEIAAAPKAPDPADAAAESLTPAAPAAKDAPGAKPGSAEAPKPAAEAPSPAPTIVTREDGSMLVDNRFVVKGQGTAAAPYEVTWEMLVSANETYDPKIGRKKLPGRVTMLDGKYVRLVGYVAYPMFVDQPRELLSMLNQWDGCCIGVPPTPYDAVEVHLKAVVSKEERLATYGSVEGKFEVKPYLAGDWLVGLYVMEDAALGVKEYNGSGT